MGRYAIIDKQTGKVLNVIEAEQSFFESKPLLVDAEGKLIDWEQAEVVQSEVASVGDIVINGQVYRYQGEL